MRTRTSDIWNSYEELMVKNAVDESAEVKKYKKDPRPRVGSDEEGTAQYNTKPEPSKGMEYKRNIIELAHPNAVILTPSYDPVNALVENENERADIIRNILMNKPLPSGTIRLQRYATLKDLSMELIRTANHMDNADQQDLRELVDDCLNELNKEAMTFDEIREWLANKTRDVGAVGEGTLAGAGIGGLIGGLVGVFGGPLTIGAGAAAGAALGGIVAALAKTGPQVQSIQENAKDVLNQLNDLKKKIPEQNNFFLTVEEGLEHLIGDANRYINIVDDLKLKDLKEHHTVTETEQKDIETLAKSLKTQMDMAVGLARMFAEKVEKGEFAKAEPSKALSPLYWFINDDIQDVQAAFSSLLEAIHNFKTTMKDVRDEAQAHFENEPKPEMPKSTNQTGPNSNEAVSGLRQLLNQIPGN